MIYIDGEKCAGCGVCEDVCPVEAVQASNGVARIDQDRCNECEACVEACPNEAILVVIEPTEEKAISLREQPRPEVAPAEPHRSRVVPVVGAALSFLGHEVAPRLATYLVDALDRRLSRQPTLRQPFDSAQGKAQDAAAVSPTNSLAPSAPLSPPRVGGRKGEEQKDRRHRHRRQGK
jgi:ferredoxin